MGVRVEGVRGDTSRKVLQRFQNKLILHLMKFTRQRQTRICLFKVDFLCDIVLKASILCLHLGTS